MWQTLPLPYFDAHTHGELMSRFTNDVDTLNDALNNSFAMLIQSAVMIHRHHFYAPDFETSGCFHFVIFFLAMMALFIQWNGKRSRRFYTEQQIRLGSMNGFVEEMVSGQKVEKVFNHEDADFQEFCDRNEKLRKASTKALTYSGVTVRYHCVTVVF